MARGTTAAVDDYFLSTTTPITGPPFSVSMWFYAINLTTGGFPWSLADGDTSTRYFAFLMNATSGNFHFRVNDGTSTDDATIASAISAGQWHHIFLEAAAIDSRSVWVDDGTPGTTGNSRTPSGIDRIGIGCNARSTTQTAMDARYAECGLWNRALSDGERAALANRYAPSFFLRGLQQYNSLIRGVDGSDGDEVDQILGTVYHETNTPTVEDHPGMIYPSGPLQIGVPSAAVDTSWMTPMSVPVDDPVEMVSY